MSSRTPVGNACLTNYISNKKALSWKDQCAMAPVLSVQIKAVIPACSSRIAAASSLHKPTNHQSFKSPWVIEDCALKIVFIWISSQVSTDAAVCTVCVTK